MTSTVSIHWRLHRHTSCHWLEAPLPGRPRRTWHQQMEWDMGLPISACQFSTLDRSLWRSLRPSAGQAWQWVSDRSNPRWRPAAILENFKWPYISATGRPIHFMFGSRVGFSGTADLMALFPVRSNPRWRPAAILEISKEYISGMRYPSLLHEIEIIFAEIWERRMREE